MVGFTTLFSLTAAPFLGTPWWEGLADPQLSPLPLLTKDLNGEVHSSKASACCRDRASGDKPSQRATGTSVLLGTLPSTMEHNSSPAWCPWRSPFLSRALRLLIWKMRLLDCPPPVPSGLEPGPCLYSALRPHGSHGPSAACKPGRLPWIPPAAGAPLLKIYPPAALTASTQHGSHGTRRRTVIVKGSGVKPGAMPVCARKWVCSTSQKPPQGWVRSVLL